MPLFGRSHKSPPEIIRNLREALTTIERGAAGGGDPKKMEKAAEEVNRWLAAVKLIIYGQENQEPHTEQVSAACISIRSNAKNVDCTKTLNFFQ